MAFIDAIDCCISYWPNCYFKESEVSSAQKQKNTHAFSFIIGLDLEVPQDRSSSIFSHVQDFGYSPFCVVRGFLVFNCGLCLLLSPGYYNSRVSDHCQGTGINGLDFVMTIQFGR